MNVELPRITARVNLETQELLKQASALLGISSINAFVVSAAIEKAKRVIEEEHKLVLSQKDAMLFLSALDEPVTVNARLEQAFKNYETK
jgi:uncharacterized protein (DUF1778 family)